MTQKERDKVHSKFLLADNQNPMWVVATSGFGLGIGMQGLDCVFMFGLPYSLSELAQRMSRLRGSGEVIIWRLPEWDWRVFRNVKPASAPNASTKMLAIEEYIELCYAASRDQGHLERCLEWQFDNKLPQNVGANCVMFDARDM